MITQNRLKEVLNYDAERGLFTWKMTRSRFAYAGNVAGGPHSRGYIVIAIDGVRYFAHRLAWLYVTGAWPVHQIDHKDRNKTNNQFCNLREATPHQNSVNSPPRRSRTGFKGVIVRKNSFMARIHIRGKSIHLGTFRTPREAHSAYATAALLHFGEFARLTA